MATIVKAPSDGWKAVIRLTGWPTVAKTFRLKRDAEDWARRVEDEMVRGIYVHRAPSERMTVSMAIERYLKEVSPTKKASTERGEHIHAKAVNTALGKYALASVTADVVAKFRDARLEAGKSNNTVRLELAFLGHLFTIAIKEWRLGLTYNPVHNIRKPSPGAGRDRRLLGDEEQRLRQAVSEHSNPMIRWIFEVAVETGMRSSEITSLRRSQIELERRIVRLPDTKNNTPRTVPLTKVAVDALREALSNPIRPIDTDLVFFGEPGKDGKRRPYNFNKVWQRIKQEVGCKDLRFHDLRHEAVSRLVEGGFSDMEVMAVSGHKSTQMLKRYTHLRAEDLVARLDSIKK
jgi:integrase